MKFRIIVLLTIVTLTFNSCSLKTEKVDKEAICSEIRNVEAAFQKKLLTDGVANAFSQFAAENAVIKRENDTLIIGKEAIRKYYSNPFYDKAIAVWTPDYIDISEDGTMAYTYGKYRWTLIDSLGEKTYFSGVFHTVWKKNGGDWMYVWD